VLPGSLLYPASSRDPVKQETGVDDLARMNVNKGVLDSPKDGPHTKNPEDLGRYELKDHRTPEEKKRHLPTLTNKTLNSAIFTGRGPEQVVNVNTTLVSANPTADNPGIFASGARLPLG